MENLIALGLVVVSVMGFVMWAAFELFIRGVDKGINTMIVGELNDPVDDEKL